MSPCPHLSLECGWFPIIVDFPYLVNLDSVSHEGLTVLRLLLRVHSGATNGDARMLKYYFEADRPTMEDDCVVIIRITKMQTNANELAKNVNKQ